MFNLERSGDVRLPSHAFPMAINEATLEDKIRLGRDLCGEKLVVSQENIGKHCQWIILKWWNTEIKKYENIGKQEITGSFRQIQDNPGICNTNGLQNKRISDSSKNRSPK